jgi:hypothetical protein
VKRRTAKTTRSRIAAKRGAKRRATPRVAPRAAARRKKASTKARRPEGIRRPTAAEMRADEIYEQQIQSVWERFGLECLQFAEGFNNELGSHLLHVQSNASQVVANLAMGGEVMVQLDREGKHVGCWITSQCGDLGSCVVEQPPIGLAVEDDRLRLVYGATPLSEDDLAVKLLTYLVQIDPSNPQPASQ